MHLDDVDLDTGIYDGPARPTWCPCAYCGSVANRWYLTWESSFNRSLLEIHTCNVCWQRWRVEVISPEGFSCP